MGRLVDIDALGVGGIEALANEHGMRLITKETYEDFRNGFGLRAATERPEPDRWNLPFGSYAPVIADTPIADPPPGWSDRDVMQRVLSALENPTEDALRDAKDELRYRLRAATERPRTEPLDVERLGLALAKHWHDHPSSGYSFGNCASEVSAEYARLSPPAATQEGTGE